MKNLFYSEKDDTLFWIAGYTMYDNTSLVIDKIKYLQENANKFSEFCEISIETVRTDFITKSSKYKNMRVFYVVDPPKLITDIYHLGSDWDMWKWLEN